MTAAIPSKVKVAAHQVDILWTGEMDTLWGDFSSDRNRIRVDTTRPADSLVAETLIHEILHGIYYYYNIQEDADEEQTVSSMAAGLTQVIQDNPKVMKFITERLKQ